MRHQSAAVLDEDGDPEIRAAVSRQTDAKAINAILNHPNVRPFIDSRDGAIDATPVVENPDNIALDLTAVSTSLKEAKARATAAGYKLFLTSTPCKNGHISERWAISGICCACSLDRGRERYLREPEKCREWGRLYGRKNRQKLKKNVTAYRATNKALVLAKAKKWLADRPEQRRVYTENRRARLLAAEGSHTAQEISTLLEKQAGKCVYCSTVIHVGYQEDHIIPLSRGGSNWISNIQLLCQPCNCRKSNKDPMDFAREIGHLL